MQSILNFWLLLFWFSWLLFFLNTTNLIKLFVTSELIWLILYIYSLIVGVSIDDIYMYTLSLLLITIASVEFSIGFVLIIFFKKIFKTTNIMDNINTDWMLIEKLNKK
jgi:NADH:ubiquinone oxidoreductase subunit K